VCGSGVLDKEVMGFLLFQIHLESPRKTVGRILTLNIKLFGGHKKKPVTWFATSFF
jgi:hypothetical protein